MKDIINRNNKGQLHGYQERYAGGKLRFKGFYNNGILVDYEEWYLFGGELEKSFYI